jgi:acetyl esterase/lipase
MFPRIVSMAYGTSPDQIGDLYFPQVENPPVVCLLHGGYWRMPWGREHIAPLAVPLTQLGFAVWNVEYRRVGGARGELGAAGGGWPGTLQDVGAAIDHLAIHRAAGRGELGGLDLDRVTVVGHSAGGQLALWAGAAGGEYGPRRVRVAAAVGLAPVADLRWAYEQRCGNGAVQGFLGGTPAEYPGRYREASPAERLPLGVRQLVVHGTPDEDVPVEISRRYARAAAAAGDQLTFIELPDAAHMDFVDPASGAAARLFDWLARHAPR